MNRFLSLVLAGLAGFASPSGAQAIHLSPGDRDGVQLLLLRPDIRGDGPDFPSFAAFLSGRVTLGARTRLLLEFPLANVVSSGTSDQASGNPLIGIEIGRAGAPLLVQVGARVPLSPDNNAAPFWGLLSDITQQEAWGVDFASFTTQALYRRVAEDGFVFELGGGPSLLIATSSSGETEALLQYVVRAGYESPRVRAVGGFSGSALLTEAGGVAERTLDQFVATLRVRTGALMPLGWIGLPLDDGYNGIVGVVLGVGIEFPVGPAPAP